MVNLIPGILLSLYLEEKLSPLMQKHISCLNRKKFVTPIKLKKKIDFDLNVVIFFLVLWDP